MEQLFEISRCAPPGASRKTSHPPLLQVFLKKRADAGMTLLLVLLAGCASSSQNAAPSPSPSPIQDHPPIFAQTRPEAPEISDKHVIVVPALRNVLKITKVTSEIGLRGFLRMQVNIENKTAARQQFSYRIEWFDADGQLLPEISTTTPWMLLPHERSSIAMTAPTPSARDFGVAFLDEH